MEIYYKILHWVYINELNSFDKYYLLSFQITKNQEYKNIKDNWQIPNIVQRN